MHQFSTFAVAQPQTFLVLTLGRNKLEMKAFLQFIIKPKKQPFPEYVSRKNQISLYKGFSFWIIILTVERSLVKL
jgi:hypothetical protein